MQAKAIHRVHFAYFTSLIHNFNTNTATCGYSNVGDYVFSAMVNTETYWWGKQDLGCNTSRQNKFHTSASADKQLLATQIELETDTHQ